MTGLISFSFAFSIFLRKKSIYRKSQEEWILLKILDPKVCSKNAIKSRSSCSTGPNFNLLIQGSTAFCKYTSNVFLTLGILSIRKLICQLLSLTYKTIHQNLQVFPFFLQIASSQHKYHSWKTESMWNVQPFSFTLPGKKRNCVLNCQKNLFTLLQSSILSDGKNPMVSFL